MRPMSVGLAANVLKAYLLSCVTVGLSRFETATVLVTDLLPACDRLVASF